MKKRKKQALFYISENHIKMIIEMEAHYETTMSEVVEKCVENYYNITLAKANKKLKNSDYAYEKITKKELEWTKQKS